MKGKRERLVVLLVILIVISGLIAWKVESQMLFLPHENLILSCYSPKKAYLVEFYHNPGSATVADSITGDAMDMGTGRKRTFYFCYREEDVDIKWLDDLRCMVNDRIIDIKTDVYNSKWMY